MGSSDFKRTLGPLRLRRQEPGWLFSGGEITICWRRLNELFIVERSFDFDYWVTVSNKQWPDRSGAAVYVRRGRTAYWWRWGVAKILCARYLSPYINECLDKLPQLAAKKVHPLFIRLEYREIEK